MQCRRVIRADGQGVPPRGVATLRRGWRLRALSGTEGRAILVNVVKLWNVGAIEAKGAGPTADLCQPWTQSAMRTSRGAEYILTRLNRRPSCARALRPLYDRTK